MSYETKNIRNICFIGHGNSGKTSLAESMLFTTGAIDRQGKVTDGNTVCDYDAEEIKRQITISTAVAPVNFGGCKINVLDCPGYFDFVGDVLAAIRVADTGIIFCTAKDGISVGAERSWKYLKAANVPTMFYISKLDEEHGDFYKVLGDLQAKYGSIVCPVVAPMSDGTGVIDLVHNVAYQTKGGKTAKIPVPAADADKVAELREALMETAAGASEELMEKYFEEMELCEADIVTGIKLGMKDRSVVPVVCGAAMANIGTEAVLQAVCDYVPAPDVDPAAPTLAFVFKTVSDQFGKYSFVKVMGGKITADMSLRNVPCLQHRQARPSVHHLRQEDHRGQGSLLRRYRCRRQGWTGRPAIPFAIPRTRSSFPLSRCPIPATPWPSPPRPRVRTTRSQVVFPV